MPVNPSCQQLFGKLKACVLLPTYNNAATLAAVIEDVYQYTTNVIVVNDGSTDRTEEVLQQYQQLNIICYKRNRGKGFALRTGLRAAADAGCVAYS